MFKRVRVVLSIAAAATMCLRRHTGVGQTSQKTAGYRYAACTSKGVLASTTNSHATTCKRISRGVYTVTFDRSVRGCALIATEGGDLVGGVRTSAESTSLNPNNASAHSFMFVVLCSGIGGTTNATNPGPAERGTGEAFSHHLSIYALSSISGRGFLGGRPRLRFWARMCPFKNS